MSIFLALLKGQCAIVPLLLLMRWALNRKQIPLGFLRKMHTCICFALIILSCFFAAFPGGKPDLPAATTAGGATVAGAGALSAPGQLPETIPNTPGSKPGFSTPPALALVAGAGLTLAFLLSLAGGLGFCVQVFRQIIQEKKLRAGAVKTSSDGNIRIFYVNGLQAAFASGLLLRAVYIPAGLKTEDREMRVVLAHEINHLKQGDHYRLFWESLLRHLFWYSWPARELYANGRQLRELYCDQLTARQFKSGEYLQILWQSVSRKLNGSLAGRLTTGWENRGLKGLLRRRVQLLAAGESRAGKKVCSLLLGMLLCSLLLCLVAWQIPQPDVPKRISAAGVLMDEKVEDPDLTTYVLDTDVPEEAPNVRIFTWPLPAGTGRITCPYGPRVNPFTQKNDFHYGLDIAWSRNTAVMAVRDGVVTETGYNPEGKGHYVLIKHSGEYSSQYTHLAEVLVSEGTKVSCGDVIGKLGSSGLSTGPHLHLEIRYRNSPLDPGPLLRPQDGD